MTMQRKVDSEGIIVTHFSGTHTYADAVKALEELKEMNPSTSEIYEIVLNDDNLKIKFNKEETQRIGTAVESAFSAYTRGGLAIVAKHDLAYGLSRMLEMSIHNDAISIAVFRNEKDARDWIYSIRQKRPVITPNTSQSSG